MSEQTNPCRGELANELPQHERRAAVRFACTLNTLCQTDTARPEDFWWRGIVRDISISGLGLLVPRAFEPGTLLVIEPLAKQDAFHTQCVRVIRSTREASGGWLLGCEFAMQPSGGSEVTLDSIAALR
jgi:hypothetical protein